MAKTDTLLPSPDIRDVWGYRFTWTPEHLTTAELLPLRSRYDTLADAALGRLSALRGKRDLYTTLAEEHAEGDPVLQELWEQTQTVPEWVDWEQIGRGQEVFYRYGGAMLTALAFHSLLGGMGANRIVEVLIRTGGFSKAAARRRMLETLQHILQCTLSLSSIQPGGVGHISSVKVRLLHAAVRKRILHLHSENPDYYDLENFGVPVNDLDSIVTILSFSASLIWISLPRLGIFLRNQEILDYLALWRLIAHFVGCPTTPLSTPSLARAYTESFLLTEINPTPASQILSQNIIIALSNQPPAYVSADQLVAVTRWLNGTALSNALGLPHPSRKAKAIVLAQRALICVICYTNRSIPYLDRRKISALRRVFYHMVEGKGGLAAEAGFEFQFVPQPDTRTKTEAGRVDMARRMGGLRAEVRDLAVLAVVVAGVGGWMMGAVWLFVGLMRWVRA